MTEYFFFQSKSAIHREERSVQRFLKHMTYHPTLLSNEHIESNLNVSIFRKNVKNNFELSMCQILK